MPTPQKNHDLNLPAWGPYTKRYSGISHIPDVKRGLRFDLGILPGFYRRQVLVPNAKWESAHHAWEANPNLTYYAFRYELEWKDQVYCDVSFSKLSENARMVRCEFVNQTDRNQNLVLHEMAYLNFPPVRPYSDEAIQPSEVYLPEDGLWVDGLDYEELHFARPRPNDTLVYDGMLRAEVREHGLVNGSGIGQGFGREAGDSVRYRFVLNEQIAEAALILQYRMEAVGVVQFEVEGMSKEVIEIGGDGRFQNVLLPVGTLKAGMQTLQLTSLGGADIILDGFAVVPAEQAGLVSFQPHEWNPEPVRLEGPTPNSMILKYENVDTYYGLAWNYDDFQVREILNDELDRFLRLKVHEHVQLVLRGPGEGHFTNVFMRPIPLAPHSSKVIYGLVCSGSRETVKQELARFPREETPLEAAYQQARQSVVEMAGNESGQTYQFSQSRMAATTLMNVVYPVYTRRTFIRHNTPGKWWDCLYTWDSGFIGLGLLELDVQRAVDCLNAYVTDPGDPQAAFIHHGSMVPVQMYLFQELWNRTQDRQLLEYFYPRLRQYYLFLVGRLGSSTTRVLKSNLLKTWDYFYNSGGWDDYPPQFYLHQHRLEDRVSPVVTSAQAIRSARILKGSGASVGSRQRPAAVRRGHRDLWRSAAALRVGRGSRLL